MNISEQDATTKGQTVWLDSDSHHRTGSAITQLDSKLWTSSTGIDLGTCSTSQGSSIQRHSKLITYVPLPQYVNY
jgi:hypothetical protein